MNNKPLSITETKRLIKQGAVEVNGKVIKDFSFKPKIGDKIKIGKKRFGVVVDGRQVQYVVAHMIEEGINNATVVNEFGHIKKNE